MRQTENTVINGIAYRVQQVDARVGRKIVLRLASVVGPMLASGLDVSGFELKKHLTDADFDLVCDAFAECTTIPPIAFQTTNGTINAPTPQNLAACFGDHFAGRYGDLFQWLAFCVKFNGFADFFVAAVGALPAAALAKAASDSGISKASIGSSGDSSSPST